MSVEKSSFEKFADAKKRVEKGYFFTHIGFEASFFAGSAAIVSTPGGPTLADIAVGACMVIPAVSTLSYGLATMSAGTIQHMKCRRIEAHKSTVSDGPAI